MSGVTPISGYGVGPVFTFVIDVPDRPGDLAKRWHNKYAKMAARHMMEKHHDEHIPMHFMRSARQRYGYKPRSLKYTKDKNKRWRGGGLDLVKTGRTRLKMTTEYRMKVGGSAENGNLNATLILRFPFKGGTGRFRRPSGPRGARAQVTIEQMSVEMRSFAPDEPPRLAAWFNDEYLRLVEAHRAGRKRIRIS